MNWFVLFLSFCFPITLYSMDVTITRYKVDNNFQRKKCHSQEQRERFKMYALQNDSNISGENANILGHIEYCYDCQNNTGWINKLFVEEPYRKKGIAAQLLFESCKHLKQEGCNKVSGMPFPLANSPLSLLYNESSLQAFFALQLSRFAIHTFPGYLPVNLSSEQRSRLDVGLDVSSWYMLWKFYRSRVDFYKKFGAEQSSFSLYASYDLTADTINTLEQKLQQKKTKAKL